MVTVILWPLRWTPQGNKIPECLLLDGGDDSPLSSDRGFPFFVEKSVFARRFASFYGESIPCEFQPYTMGLATVGIAHKGRMSKIWAETVARRSIRKRVLDS